MKNNSESVVRPGSRPVRVLTTVKEQPAVSDIITKSLNTERAAGIVAKPDYIALPEIADIFVRVTGKVVVDLYGREGDRDVFLCELYEKMM